MMKHMCTRILSMALCLMLAASCALADNAEIFRQRTQEGDYRSLAGMAVTGETVFFLVYHADGMELWRWQEGEEAVAAAQTMIRAGNFTTLEQAELLVGAEQARYAIAEIVSDGERLLGVNPLNGLVYEITLTQDEVVCTDVVTLEDVSPFFRNAGEGRWYSSPTAVAVADDFLYWLGTGWDAAQERNVQRITRFSLTDGSAHTVDAENATTLCAGPDGQLLILTRAREAGADGAAPANVVNVYDPQENTLSSVGEIRMSRGLNRVVYCEALDALLWQDGTNIMGMRQMGEPQRYAYVPSTLNGRLAVTGDTLVFATTKATLIRDLVPGLTAPQSLQVMNVSYGEAEAAFASAYPDVPVEVVSDDQRTSYAERLDPVNGGERLDVIRIYTTTEDACFAELAQEGRLLDLSADEAIRAYVARLYPPFRDLVTGENGEIWAVPTETVSYTGFFINRKAMTDMGLREAEMPDNMVELCEFITRWDAEYADIFPNYCCIEYAENTKRFLTDMAIDMWITHCQAMGRPLRFDDPEFRRVLDAIAAVSTVRTDLGMQVTNPEISDYKSGLFWIDCQLVGNWAAYMESYSDRIFVPFTLTENTPFHASVQGVELWVAGRNTESPEHAMRYIREQMALVNDKYAHVLLTDRTEAVESPYFAEQEAMENRRLGEMRMMLLRAEAPEEQAEWQRQINAQERFIATELQRSRYLITPSAVENYISVIAPAMHIRRDNVLQNTSDGVNAMEYIRDRWLNGRISTEQMIRELDARMMMLELAK